MTRFQRVSIASAWCLALLLAAAVMSPAMADETPAPAESATETAAPESAAPAPTLLANGLEALVPEVAAHPYRVNPGVMAFANRLSFSPAFGYLGSEKLYTLRVSYNPSSWLGYEGAVGHNPGQSVGAVLHTLSVVVRHPFASRFQPYLTGGYGMLLVSPGRSINADPVTKNALTVGGGLEFFIRGDLAIRAEMRSATVFGSERDHEGVVAYDYLQETIGFAFYRSIAP